MIKSSSSLFIDTSSSVIKRNLKFKNYITNSKSFMPSPSPSSSSSSSSPSSLHNHRIPQQQHSFFINKYHYSTATSTPSPPLFTPPPPPPTPNPQLNDDQKQHHHQQQQQQQQNKKKNNFTKYLLYGTAAGTCALPLWFLLIDNDNITPPPPSIIGASPSSQGILLSQTIDVQKIYASHSSADLLFSYFILKLCTIPFLSENGNTIIHFAERFGLSKPMYWIVKRSFFKHFVAGETLEETSETITKLNQQGIGAILDYSVEDQAGTSEAFDNVAAQIIQTIHMSSKAPVGLSFSCVKVTGLTNPNFLEKLNTIAQKRGDKQMIDIEFLKNPKSLYTTGTSALSASEIKELDELVDRLDSIFRQCHAQGVPILVDAEQSYYQHCIHHLAMSFSYKYNTQKPLIYNTYQMYLASGMNSLNDHLQVARQNGFKLGVKLVRGAYMNTERARAQKYNYPDPILPNIQETHHSYFTAMEMLLNELSKDQNQLGVMIASHNEQSISYGAERVKQLGLDSKSPNIQFGQLYGMGDYLTYGLVNRDQRVFKYVPFGPVKDVLPYLVRRMQENKGFIGTNSATELAFLKKEIQRRFKSSFTSL